MSFTQALMLVRVHEVLALGGDDTRFEAGSNPQGVVLPFCIFFLSFSWIDAKRALATNCREGSFLGAGW